MQGADLKSDQSDASARKPLFSVIPDDANAAITVWREADRRVENPSLIQRSGIYNGLRVAFAAQHHHQVGYQCSAAGNVKLDDFLC